MESPIEDDNDDDIDDEQDDEAVEGLEEAEAEEEAGGGAGASTVRCSAARGWEHQVWLADSVAAAAIDAIKSQPFLTLSAGYAMHRALFEQRPLPFHASVRFWTNREQRRQQRQ